MKALGHVRGRMLDGIPMGLTMLKLYGTITLKCLQETYG